MSATVWLRASVGFMVVVCLYGLVYASAAAPSGDPVRFGLRGLKRARALEQNELWRSIEPLVRWVGRRMRGWFTPEQMAAVDQRIERAGDYLGLVPEEFYGLTVVSAAACTLLGAVVGRLSGLSHLATAIGFAYGCFATHFALTGATAQRLNTITRRLPHTIDLLALAMGAGLDFPGSVRQAIEKAGDSSDPLVEELSLVLQSINLGRTRQQALQEFARRAPSDAVLEFVGAVVQAELRGTPVAHVLQIQAGVARQARSTRAEERAARASIQLLIPLMLVFLCVLILVVAPIGIKLANSGG